MVSINSFSNYHYVNGSYIFLIDTKIMQTECRVKFTLTVLRCNLSYTKLLCNDITYAQQNIVKCEKY